MFNTNITIHTVEFTYSTVSISDQEYIPNNFTYDKKRSTNKRKIYTAYSRFEGIRYEYRVIEKPQFKSQYLKVIANPRKILKKSSLLLEDYERFMRTYHMLIMQELSFETLQDEKFSRVDYFIDIEFTPDIKKLLLRIYNKLPAEYRGLKKNARYRSSIYFNSVSRGINVYSRLEKERSKLLEYFSNKSKVNIETEIDPYISKHDKNTIRYEVQIKRKKIWYNFKGNNKNSYGITPELFNYWNQRDAMYYINQVLKPVILAGDYYNKYHARKKLLQRYNERTVDTLIKFQNYMSEHGANATKAEYKKNYSKYINKLIEAEVNPLLIPYNTGVKYIENPLKFFNKPKDISKDIYRIPTNELTGLINAAVSINI